MLQESTTKETNSKDVWSKPVISTGMIYPASKGWRIIDGKKSYLTFRNGKKVEVSGREAFALSMADNKKTLKRDNIGGNEKINENGKKRKNETLPLQASSSPLRKFFNSAPKK
jgi:hypothetical protein